MPSTSGQCQLDHSPIDIAPDSNSVPQGKLALILNIAQTIHLPSYLTISFPSFLTISLPSYLTISLLSCLTVPYLSIPLPSYLTIPYPLTDNPPCLLPDDLISLLPDNLSFLLPDDLSSLSPDDPIITYLTIPLPPLPDDAFGNSVDIRLIRHMVLLAALQHTHQP